MPVSKQKTASRDFFDPLLFSLETSHLESKTASRFKPLLFYDSHRTVRFTSIDPIINKKEALSNPQLWNLYAYCRNNPITYNDPDRRDTYVLMYGDPGLGKHNVGGLFEMAVTTREMELNKSIGKKDNLIVRKVSSVKDMKATLKTPRRLLNWWKILCRL